MQYEEHTRAMRYACVKLQLGEWHMKLREIGLGASLMGSVFVPAAGAFAQATTTRATPSKVDLLFVVDNSSSMQGEQTALRAQIPALIRQLTQDPDHPVKDLHVGVVSTDMGIPGVEFPPSCHADGGDDGRLRHRPDTQAAPSCEGDYPQYQSYDARYDNADQIADAVSCTATLGLGGCGFEQPLESAFKALWPRADDTYRFISTTIEGTYGRGDVPEAEGGNLGFLRNDPDDPSLIAIVLLTDEEDCSVKTTEHLKPNNQLPEDSPYRQEDINLRCFLHKEFQYDLKIRYLDGLRALRPGREDLVFFSVIAGVPTDLVDSAALQNVNFDDSASRERFYSAILNDMRMQEQVDPATSPGTGQGNLKPSCSRVVAGETTPSTAYPPRRLVELARQFGEQGFVQSICQDDLSPAVSAILERLIRR